jgi:hypothetical protein
MARIIEVTFPDNDDLPDRCLAAILLAPEGFEVAVQEVRENHGRSVTNSWTNLADAFLATYMPRVAFQRVRWFEVYPYYYSNGLENVSRVFPRSRDRRFQYEQDPVVRQRIWQSLGLNRLNENTRFWSKQP